jgi:tetratricopeptide (TPR) repeat protein
VNDLIREIHRRSLWQVLGIYGAASWGVLQVVEVVTNSVGLPDWTPAMALVLLLIGLPICLGTAFVQEGMGRHETPTDGDSTDGVPTAGTFIDGARRDGATPDGTLAGGAETVGAPSSVRGLLTWKNALLGGVGAFALLGFTLVAYFVLWTTGLGPQGSLVAQGVFEEGETVVLADFEDGTGASLGDVVTDAIRVDLQESTVINLAAPTFVDAVLNRMGRDQDADFFGATARELAQREGLKAVIQGDIAAVGGGFLLTASLVAAETGDVLRAFRVPVSSEAELLNGIDKLSQDIREKSGESLKTIRSGRPLEEVTTGSFEALRLLSAANDLRDHGEPLEAIPLLERALDIDPEFAMAWRALAVIMWNTGTDGNRMVEASTRAFELREHLTDREAALAEAWFRFSVEGDPEGAISAYERLLDRYPGESHALNNIGVHSLQLGRWDEALSVLEELTSQPGEGSDNALGNLMVAQWNSGQREAAWVTLARQEEQFPEGQAMGNRYMLLGASGRWDDAMEVARLERSTKLGDASVQVFSRASGAGYALGLGFHDRAMRLLADAKRVAVERGNIDLHLGSSVLLRVWTAYALEGIEAVPDVLDEVLPPALYDEITLTNSQSNILGVLMLGGRSDEARKQFDRWGAQVPVERRGVQHRRLQTSMDAWGAIAEGDEEEAYRLFEVLRNEVITCGETCPFWGEHGRLADALGDSDRAIELYERHLNDTPVFWAAYMAPWTPVVLERLGALYTERGDTALARARLETLVATYENGDGPFVPFVARARSSLAALDAN